MPCGGLSSQLRSGIPTDFTWITSSAAGAPAVGAAAAGAADDDERAGEHREERGACAAVWRTSAPAPSPQTGAPSTISESGMYGWPRSRATGS